MAKKTQAEKAAQNEEAKGNDDSMNDDEEPNFSDPEGFVDDITDEGEHRVVFSLVQIPIAMTHLHLTALPREHGESCIYNASFAIWISKIALATCFGESRLLFETLPNVERRAQLCSFSHTLIADVT